MPLRPASCSPQGKSNTIMRRWARIAVYRRPERTGRPAMTGHVGIAPSIDPWSHSPGSDYREGFMDESLALLGRVAPLSSS